MSLLALHSLAYFLGTYFQGEARPGRAPIAPCHPPLAGSPSRRACYLSA